MHVLHNCDNRACVNPAHLFLGTNMDNIRDRDTKGRQAHNRGERAGGARLTVDDVVAIRSMHRGNDVTQKELAFMFDVEPSTIRLVLSRRNWSHV